MVKLSELRRIGEIIEQQRMAHHQAAKDVPGIVRQLNQLVALLRTGSKSASLREVAERVLLDINACRARLVEFRREVMPVTGETVYFSTSETQLSDLRVAQLHALDSAAEHVTRVIEEHSLHATLLELATGKHDHAILDALAERISATTTVLASTGAEEIVRKPFLVLHHDQDSSVVVGDSKDGVHRYKPGDVPWAFFAVLSQHGEGRPLRIADLASRLDLVLAKFDEEVFAKAARTARKKGILVGDDRYEKTQYQGGRGRERPTYTGLSPKTVVERVQASLRKVKARGAEEWRQEWLHWDRREWTLTLEWRGKQRAGGDPAGSRTTSKKQNEETPGASGGVSVT